MHRRLMNTFSIRVYQSIKGVLLFFGAIHFLWHDCHGVYQSIKGVIYSSVVFFCTAGGHTLIR